MALATLFDVEARLGRQLTIAESNQSDDLIEEADVLALAYLGLSADPDPVPTAVTVVVSRMVARVLMVARVFERAASPQSVPPGSESLTQQAGPFSMTTRFQQGAASGGPWLTATDKLALKPHRTGGGIAGVSMTSGRTGAYRTLDG